MLVANFDDGYHVVSKLMRTCVTKIVHIRGEAHDSTWVRDTPDELKLNEQWPCN